jgi:hypothetical protein
MLMKEPTQFIVNERGEKIAVVIPMEEYEEILDRLEDLIDIRAIDEARASGEVGIP